jgi:UDP-N-acetylmuramate dehydrogenase
VTRELGEVLRETGFRGRVRREVPLAPFTTWRIGGPAELLAVPADVEDVACAVRAAATAGVPWRVLGNGSNLLVSDDGVRGVVLHVRKVLDRCTVRDDTIEVGAGALFPRVANLAAAAGLAGIEFGAGVPGTVGGAVVMNAGWHEHEIGSVIRSVDWIDARGERNVVGHDEGRFRYRGSRFRDERGIVVAATLALRPDRAEAIRPLLDHYVAARKASQPTEVPSCGSVFLKPPGDYAGRLIDEAGLKGARVGAVEVSPKHANFFVNLGGATAEDVLRLVAQVERVVLDRYGVRLEREFEIWRDSSVR